MHCLNQQIANGNYYQVDSLSKIVMGQYGKHRPVREKNIRT